MTTHIHTHRTRMSPEIRGWLSSHLLSVLTAHQTGRCLRSGRGQNLNQIQVPVSKGHLGFSGAGSGSCPRPFLGLDKLVFLHSHNITFLIHSPGLKRQMLKSGRQLGFRRLLLLSPGLAQGTPAGARGWGGLLPFQPGCGYVFASTYLKKKNKKNSLCCCANMASLWSLSLSRCLLHLHTMVLTVEAACWDSDFCRDLKLDKMVSTEETKILPPSWSST